MTHDHNHHDHDHHHDHGHSHDHGDGGADEVKKLKMRIEHWIGHNREHRETLDEWAGRSGEMGLGEVSAALKRSAELMAESVAELEKSLEFF